MSDLPELLREGARSITNDGTPSQVGRISYDLCAAANTIETQQSRIEVLERALEPFALAADDLDDGHGDHADIWEAAAAMAITAGQLRAARQAFKGWIWTDAKRAGDDDE